MDVRIQPYQLRKLKGFRTYVGGKAVSRKPVELSMAIKQSKALLNIGSSAKVKSYSLSDEDMKKVIPTLKVVSYPEILGANSLDEILDDKGRLMLLYLTENEHTGHWICLLKRRGTKTIEFFDPYGNIRPDGESQWLNENELEQFGQDTFHLSKLIRESPYKLIINKTAFQSEQNNMNTCGRHCLTRLYMKHLSLTEYTKLVLTACKEAGITPDDFVVGLTYNLIHR